MCFFIFLNRLIDKIRKHQIIVKSRNFMENLIYYYYFFFLNKNVRKEMILVKTKRVSNSKILNIILRKAILVSLDYELLKRNIKFN